jgi:hypothetical protein
MLHPTPILARMSKEPRIAARDIESYLDFYIWEGDDHKSYITLLAQQAPIVQEYFEALGWHVYVYRYHGTTNYVKLNLHIEDKGIDKSVVYSFEHLQEILGL